VKRFLFVGLMMIAACGETTSPEVTKDNSGNTTKPVDVKKKNPENGGALVNKLPDQRPEEPAIKSIPSIDLSALPAERKQVFLEVLNNEISPCDRPETLAACAVSKQSCLECGYMTRSLYRLTRDSELPPEKDQLSQFLGGLKESITAKPVAGFDLTNVVSLGKGPVVVVEYADFQCPHCAETHKTLKNLLPSVSDKITFYFKNFPLPSHTLAEPAARATLAAARQGKFWEMHHTIFERQEQITAEIFEVWAKELGLDVAKFKADFIAPEIAAQVARDRKESEAFGFRGTPSMLIDGRLYADQLTPDAIKDAFEFAAAKRAQPTTPQ
jgi:protein-disulfide isomerase